MISISIQAKDASELRFHVKQLSRVFKGAVNPGKQPELPLISATLSPGLTELAAKKKSKSVLKREAVQRGEDLESTANPVIAPLPEQKVPTLSPESVPTSLSATTKAEAVAALQKVVEKFGKEESEAPSTDSMAVLKKIMDAVGGGPISQVPEAKYGVVVDLCAKAIHGGF